MECRRRPWVNLLMIRQVVSLGLTFIDIYLDRSFGYAMVGRLDLWRTPSVTEATEQKG
jgi:hypothetical protein